MRGANAKCSAVLLAAALAACGGGGSGGSGDGGGPVAGIDGGGILVQGPITQFGSVFVNGVEYSTTGAVITVGGAPATEADLRIGQVVTVTGTLSATGGTPSAARIDFAPTLSGPVQAVDDVAETLLVAGITVRIDGSTSLDDTVTGIDGLRVGDFVEVSGYTDAAGDVLASRIERKTAGEVHVQGPVAHVDTSAKTFTIGSLEVDYSNAASVENFGGGAPADGDLVEADGTLDAGALLASRLVRLEPDLAGTAGERTELEGPITRVVSGTQLEVSGQSVSITSATAYENGAAADLAAGRIVAVQGRFDAAGAIAADSVDFRPEGELELTGTVAALGDAAHTFQILGTTVGVDSMTRFEDKTGGDAKFSLSNLHLGDYLEVRAYQGDGLLVATRVTRESPQSEVDLRGVIDALALPQFTLLGQTIVTTLGTRFRDSNGNDVDQVTFFADAAVGTHMARVKGTMTQGTTTVDAAEVRLED